MADLPASPPPAEPPQMPPGAAGEPPESTGAPPPAQPPADPTEPREGDSDDVAQLRREAGNYRRQLRAAETERDQLRTRIDEFERGEVERIAQGAGAAVPNDIWLLIQSLDELRVDGALNTDRARERIDGILKERPSWKRPPAPEPSGGSRLGNGLARPSGLYDLLQRR